MDFIERVKSWFGAVKAAPTERKVADMVADGGVTNDKFPGRVDGKPFNAGTTYFGLRLSGLHLVDGRRFLTQRLPLAVCLAEFQTGGEQRSVPFSIGPDVIRKRLADAGVKEDLGKPTWIELQDLTIVRPTPTNDGNLSLYTGLFSVPGDDLVKTLLNVVGTIGTALADPAVAPALKVAETIYGSFGALLGFNQVDELVAALLGNALTDRGSGYLLVANTAPQSFDTKRARVDGGRLCWPAVMNGGHPVIEFDHALIALERFETVAEAGTGLAESLFGQGWAAVRKAIRPETANEALEKLRDAVAASPDLIEDDRLRLLTAYGAAATKLADVRWPNAKAPGVRGALTSSLLTRLDNLTARRAQGGGNAVADRVRAAADQVERPLELSNPESRDAAATREHDNLAIFRLASAIQIPQYLDHADARDAAMSVANAIAPSP